MARTTRSSGKTASPDASAVLAALSALGIDLEALAKPAAKPAAKRTTATKAKPQFDPSRPAARSQVFLAFFLMAREHYGLNVPKGDWPTNGQVQAIIDALQ